MHLAYELWKPSEVNKQASVEWWDSMAKDFAGHEKPEIGNSLAMRIISRDSMVANGTSVLDVGCGAGRYSIALAEQGATVCGIDISPKMIEFAGKAAGKSTQFFVEDWHALSLETRGWKKSFDLVLANMTPAIISAETFMKLSEASRNWCLMVKPARRTNSIYDALNELVGAQRDTKQLDETIEYAFNLLWDSGYCPKLDYDKQVWYNKKTVDEAVFQYTKRIESFKTLNDQQKECIKDYLESKADNGFVEETTHTMVVAMYWQV